MGFADLEERLKLLEPESYKVLSSVLDSIRRSPMRNSSEYAEMIRYFLTIYHHLEENGHTKSAYTIGGYAVMSYLVHEFGHDVCKVWRGSGDIDLIITDPSVLDIVKAFFEERLQRRSHIPNKYSLEVKDADTALPDLICEVDLYRCWGDNLRINERAICKDFFDNSSTITVCGVKVSLPSIVDLIKLKLDVKNYVGSLRPKDRADIVDLVSILVNRGIGLNDLYTDLSREENAVLVDEVFAHKDRPAPTTSQLAGNEHLERRLNFFLKRYSAHHKCTNLVP